MSADQIGSERYAAAEYVTGTTSLGWHLLCPDNLRVAMCGLTVTGSAVWRISCSTSERIGPIDPACVDSDVYPNR